MDCRLTVYIFMIPIRFTLPLILILLASYPYATPAFIFPLFFPFLQFIIKRNNLSETEVLHVRKNGCLL